MKLLDDEFFMKEALKEALQAFESDEVPVGAVLVFENKIVARAHNSVEKNQDASCHAEMLCLRAATQYFNHWRLLNTTLYTTLEPCAMCAGAMLLHRIKRLVWGAPDLRQGAHGSWVNILDASHPIHSIDVVKGVLEKQSASLMQSFFKQKRTS